MSLKDTRFFRTCPICDDTLPGTDDGIMIFESLAAQLAAAPDETPNCCLCGDEAKSLVEARDIVARGTPKLRRTQR